MKKEEARKAYDALMKFYPLTLDDLDGEQWRDIDGYEGLYQISNFGRIKSFWSKKTKILKPCFTVHGYLRIDLSDGNKGKHFRINRLVAKAFLSNADHKPQVNHIDGCKLNNFVGNLEWVTSSENNQHAFSTGLNCARRGSNNSRAKLTNEQVLYIRDNPENLTIKELANTFSVDARNISAIQLGRKYTEASGKIRKAMRQYISTDDRQFIRLVHKPYDIQFGTKPLAKRFGVDERTIAKIVHQGDGCNGTTTAIHARHESANQHA